MAGCGACADASRSRAAEARCCGGAAVRTRACSSRRASSACSAWRCGGRYAACAGGSRADADRTGVRCGCETERCDQNSRPMKILSSRKSPCQLLRLARADQGLSRLSCRRRRRSRCHRRRRIHSRCRWRTPRRCPRSRPSRWSRPKPLPAATDAATDASTQMANAAANADAAAEAHAHSRSRAIRTRGRVVARG